MQGMIEIQGLSRWYGDVIGLNDVTLSIDHGVVGLLGHNGAGKSTLMKIITGQIQPSRGALLTLGQNPWNNADLMLRVGFCPEQDTFYEFMSGLEFVEILTRLHGFEKYAARKLAEEALDRVQMTYAMHRPIKAYSKGMRQRTKIAQALAHKPDLLILDEPLTGTDPTGRKIIIDLVKQLGKEGKDVLMSSHVLHEVEAMTSNVVFMTRGRVAASGHILDLRDEMDKQPHHIIVECQPLREFASKLVALDYIVGVDIEESKGRLMLLVQDPERFYDEFPRLARENNVAVRSMGSEDDSLQAVFKYLVK